MTPCGRAARKILPDGQPASSMSRAPTTFYLLTCLPAQTTSCTAECLPNLSDMQVRRVMFPFHRKQPTLNRSPPGEVILYSLLITAIATVGMVDGLLSRTLPPRVPRTGARVMTDYLCIFEFKHPPYPDMCKTLAHGYDEED